MKMMIVTAVVAIEMVDAMNAVMLGIHMATVISLKRVFGKVVMLMVMALTMCPVRE